ncbi:MAG TPA: tripartite tricarboxylate transporter substrate binding protein [Burkholderiales bacterium]|jgi:tripartite-type tricarboxylate transporter receptor subunit TctC|nr:tripartite tricarboxylate transporter substrate binding protein [Burkholderiales bacterium]
MKARLSLLAIVAGAAVVALFSTAVGAQSFPSRAITIIVPYPPGGLIDLVARIIQAPMQADLGQPVAVENRAGAGGNVGADFVAHAPADGYTLLLANPSLAISPSIYRKLNYRPMQDLVYVGRFGSVPNVLVVNPALPVKTAQELVEYAKKNPGKLNYGSPGYGTSPQLSSELFKAMTHTFIVHIPFRGAGPSIAALLANDVQMMIDNIPPQVPLIKSGKVRALAVTSLHRVDVLPDVPTMDEIGLKGYEIVSWFGLAAPAGTPPAVIKRLNESLNHASQDPKARAALDARGATVVQGSPEDFTAFVKSETEKFAPIVKRAGVVID